ncbi:MAG: formylglycine-generating enzyme family protein [Rhodospirillaceae bacterium]
MIRRGILFCIALLATGPCFAVDTFQDCPECPEMAVIPPGSFFLGSPSTERTVSSNEGPQHKVTISRAFAVGIYDVTFDQWFECISGGGCNGYWPQDEDWGRGKRPVINVNREDALGYVRWLNDKVRNFQQNAAPLADPGPYRLLSEAEWEYAARAGTTTTYYWGETHGVGNANCDGCGSQWDNKQTAPVGSFAPNPFGLYDMAGNVLQWIEDCYHENYAGAPADGSAWTKGKCYARSLRGGSWYNSTYYLRSANRYSAYPDFRGRNVGFRVAKTLD